MTKHVIRIPLHQLDELLPYLKELPPKVKIVIAPEAKPLKSRPAELNLSR